MKKVTSKVIGAAKKVGLFLLKNKRNIGILAMTVILPGINAYFPEVFTEAQYDFWMKGAKGLAVVGLGHNVLNNTPKIKNQKKKDSN